MSTQQKEAGNTKIAVQQTTELSTEMQDMLAQDAGAGLENVRAEDMSVPYLVVLQKNSPQVDDANGKYIEGAKQGQFLETGTMTVYDEAMVIPCDFKSAIVEWHPRETGGGFVSQHEPGYEEKFPRNDRGQWVTDQGTLLVQTMYFFCLLLQPSGDAMPCVLSFTSSQLKKAKTWVTRLTSKKVTGKDGKKFTPPIYEMVWKLTTTPEANDKGTWRGIAIEPVKSIDDLATFQAARAAKAMFAKTRSNVAPVSMANPTEE